MKRFATLSRQPVSLLVLAVLYLGLVVPLIWPQALHFAPLAQPRPAPQRHLVLKPLEREEDEPELVLLLVNAHQAHRIHSILNYREGDLMIPHFYSAICQGTITNPISLNKPTVTFPDTMGRDVGGFGENDIIFSFPLAYFLRLVEDLRASDGGEEKIAPGVKDLLKMIH